MLSKSQLLGMKPTYRHYLGSYMEFHNEGVSTKGIRVGFTSYLSEREEFYNCYWYGGEADNCRNKAGWHGFIRTPRRISDEVHVCTKHWRILMGYSPA